MSGYVLGAGAECDLDAIWEYIAADSLDAADRWIGKLFDAFEALGQARGSATVVKTSRPIRSSSGRSARISSPTVPSAGRVRSRQ